MRYRDQICCRSGAPAGAPAAVATKMIFVEAQGATTFVMYTIVYHGRPGVLISGGSIP